MEKIILKNVRICLYQPDHWLQINQNCLIIMSAIFVQKKIHICFFVSFELFKNNAL